MTVTQPSKLFQPVTVGDINLKHRVVLAPLTRMRASQKTGIPSDLALSYYSQRASDGGLLISEGTLVAEEARSYDFVPGIWSAEQVEGWKKITAAVHAKGAHFYCQLFSNGRAAPAQPGAKVLGASAIPLPGFSQEVIPMTEEDIDRYVEHYKQAAVNAIEAGFDGVEIHYANGYHLDQFLQSVSNQRTDAYGGSLANRFRFPLRVLSAVSSAIGASRVGIRISPFSRFQDMREANPLATFVPFTEAVLAAEPELAYVHAVDGRISGAEDISDNLVQKEDSLDEIREVVKRLGKKTVFIVAGGISPERVEDHVQKYDELIAFGRYFTSNPDLPQRIKNGWPLKAYHRPTFYTQTAEGYNDFPEYTPVEAQQVKVTV
ncbi:hypothetical protein IAT38_007816 [Cryptococcus sp. DSM 104549]